MTRLLSDVDGETDTASYSPKTPWEVVVSVCKNEKVSPEIIIRPGDHKEHKTVMTRGRVFRKLAEELSVKMIAEISGMSERRIYEILGEKKL